jgi:outer membrane lipoprotein SlyB
MSSFHRRIGAVLVLCAAAAVPTVAQADACKPDCGKVQSVNKTAQEGKGSGVGAVAGGVVGGLIGNQIGQGTGRTVATVAGVAGGAYAGHQVEKKTKSKDVYTVSVKMDNGQTTNYEYDTHPGFAAGDRVQIVNGKPQRYTGK